MGTNLCLGRTPAVETLFFILDFCFPFVFTFGHGTRPWHTGHALALPTAFLRGRSARQKQNPETKGKTNIFLEHILRPIRKPISSLPGHFRIGVKMTLKNI